MKRGTLFFKSSLPHANTTMLNLKIYSMECSAVALEAAPIKPLLRMAVKKLAHRSKYMLLVKLSAQDIGRCRLWRTIP